MTLLAEPPRRNAMAHTRGPEFQLRSEMRFAALPTAIICAQLFIKFTLQTWRLDEISDSAQRIVTELVTRAVKTTGISDPNPHWIDPQDLTVIGVRVVVVERRLILEVADSDPTLAMETESHRLHVVPSLCKRWDCYRPPTGGKTIWCELLLGMSQDIAPDATQEIPRQLPRRIRNQDFADVDPIETFSDPRLLRQIRDGLRGIDDESSGGGGMR